MLKVMIKITTLTIIVFLLSYTLSYASNIRTVEHHSNKYIDLSGTWDFIPNIKSQNHTIDESKWEEIKVPSNWYKQGYDFHGKALYRKIFNLPSSWKKKNITLIFNGVDYYADVYLNGHAVGHHEGYFQSFSFDISPYVHYNQKNILEVRVNSPLEDVDNKHGKDWSLHKRLIKGVLNHHDTRPGGAWGVDGQDGNTGGIWAPVTLKASSCVTVLHQRITPLQNAVEIGYKINSHAWMNGQIITRIVPANFTGQSFEYSENIRLQPGYNEYQSRFKTPKVKLWWPYELGEQNLYYAITTIKTSNRNRLSPAGIGAACHDEQYTRFGFRKVEYSQNKKAWFINGKRLFQRGTNYIPTLYLSEFNKEKFSKDINMMKDAHINAVRVHAHVTHKDFYELADEEGLLVWQDFPLQWGYEDTKKFKTESLKQLKDMIHQYYNYPSIISWQLHNEPPWDAWWMKGKYKEYSKKQNHKVDKALFTQARALDETRYIKMASTNDEHPWYGWYSKKFEDYHDSSKEVLVSEFGAQALPEYKTLVDILGKENLWPLTENVLKKWKYHNFQPRETFEIAKIKKGNSIKEFIQNSQHYQSLSLQSAAEGLRIHRYNPVGAAFQFMFNEHWPSINWGVVDYKRNPKPGYKVLKNSFEPTLAVLTPFVYENSDITKKFTPVVLNDRHKKYETVQLDIFIKNSDDKKIHFSKALQFSLSADSKVNLDSFLLPTLNKGSYDITLKLYEVPKLVAEKLISENKYSFVVPKDKSNGDIH